MGFSYLSLPCFSGWPDPAFLIKERVEEQHLLLDLTSHTPKLQQELNLFPGSNKVVARFPKIGWFWVIKDDLGMNNP